MLVRRGKLVRSKSTIRRSIVMPSGLATGSIAYLRWERPHARRAVWSLDRRPSAAERVCAPRFRPLSFRGCGASNKAHPCFVSYKALAVGVSLAALVPLRLLGQLFPPKQGGARTPSGPRRPANDDWPSLSPWPPRQSYDRSHQRRYSSNPCRPPVPTICRE